VPASRPWRPCPTPQIRVGLSRELFNSSEGHSVERCSLLDLYYYYRLALLYHVFRCRALQSFIIITRPLQSFALYYLERIHKLARNGLLPRWCKQHLFHRLFEKDIPGLPIEYRHQQPFKLVQSRAGIRAVAIVHIHADVSTPPSDTRVDQWQPSPDPTT